MTSDPPRHEVRLGILYALAAFSSWGIVAPLFFKQLKPIPAGEILAHRVLWAALLMVVLISIKGRWREVRLVVGARRTLLFLLASTLLVGVNWLIYIWAVNADRLVQTSLGYFINPLINVALGVLFLGERLRALQIAACAVAALGVTFLAATGGEPPWIALSLAISFGFYGLIRKMLRVDPLVGLMVESALLLPLALVYIGAAAVRGDGAFLALSWRTDLLLISAGAITALPLIWFAAAAHRLQLSTVGLLQYLAPTCQLLLGVLVYGEIFTAAHGVAFAAIWLALALYSADALRPGPRPGPALAKSPPKA
jgi:chloramphenicol-sensitive protein RarD